MYLLIKKKVFDRLTIAFYYNQLKFVQFTCLTLKAKTSNFVIFHPYQKKLDRDVMIKIFDSHTKEFVLLDQKTWHTA